MFEKILVHLDRTEPSESVLGFVSQLARALSATVVFHSAIDTGAVRQRQEAREAEEDWLAEIAERLTDARGVNTLFLVSVDHSADEIVRVAEADSCDLIVVASHSEGPLRRAMSGGVTERIALSTDVPMMMVAPKSAGDYWRAGSPISSVLVALDGTSLAETSLPYVEHLAKQLSLKVVLVHSVDLIGLYTGPARSGVNEKMATEYLTEVAEGLQDEGIDARLQLLQGRPAASIVNLAREDLGNVIVLTTHCRSGLSRWISGSVAETVLRTSRNPVLVTKRPPG